MPGSSFLQNVNSADFLSTPADALALAKTLAAANMYHNGLTMEPLRTPVIFKAIAAVTITADTGATVWDPASGKKFRLLGFCLSNTAACSYQFYVGLATALTNLLLQTPVIPANGLLNVGWPMLGNGILSSTANMNLNLDVVGTTPTISGWVCGTEE
jgi:hypothetical protein